MHTSASVAWKAGYGFCSSGELARYEMPMSRPGIMHSHGLTPIAITTARSCQSCCAAMPRCSMCGFSAKLISDIANSKKLMVLRDAGERR